MEGQEMVKTKKGRKKFEVIVILLVIVAALVVAFGIYKARTNAANAKLMMAELEQIRSAVTMYKTINKSNPPDLASLTKMTYTFAPGDTPRTYLSNIELNKAGKLVDPFGNPYRFDTKNGWVYSSTKGYGDW